MGTAKTVTGVKSDKKGSRWEKCNRRPRKCKKEMKSNGWRGQTKVKWRRGSATSGLRVATVVRLHGNVFVGGMNVCKFNGSELSCRRNEKC